MKMHFISTGKKFGYPYYIGVKTALKRYKGDITLHTVEPLDTPYFNLLKQEPRLKIQPIEIDTTLPVFSMELWSQGNIANMKANWKYVMMFDYLIWKTVSSEGGIIMGLDSVTKADWTHLLPENKEMLVPKRDTDNDGDYTMHGVIVRGGSQLAKLIFSDIEGVMQGKDCPGKHRGIIDGKYRWGAAGMCPYINRVLENKDKVQIVDIEKYTLPMFASSMKGFDGIDERYIATGNTALSKTVRDVLTQEEYDPLGKLKPVKQDKKKFTLHLLGLVHLPCSKEFMGCAFTQKNYKLAQMMLSLGHEVIYYGAEGSTVPCSKFVQTHTLSDIRKEWGDGDNRFSIGYDYLATGFRHDFNTKRTATTLKFYAKCIDEIKRTSKPDDFLIITQGSYHKPIDDAVKLYLTAETGIGYRGSYAKFRAFESAYIQNFTLGSANPYKSLNGNYYDRVIPNYFDPEDITFSTDKRDYFLFIGRVIKRKGVMTAYLISKELGIPLIIAGQDGKILKDGSLKGDAFTLPKGNWEYIGFAGIEKRKELMAHARACICATEYLEPFCGVHVESMLSGTPVITTNFSVFPETVLNGVNGYRCNTLDDFVRAGRDVQYLDPETVRDSAEHFLMDSVKWEFQRWFEDLYRLWQSTQGNGYKGWHYIAPETLAGFKDKVL